MKYVKIKTAILPTSFKALSQNKFPLTCSICWDIGSLRGFGGWGMAEGQIFGVPCWHGFKCEAYMLRRWSVWETSVSSTKCWDQDRLGSSVDAALGPMCWWWHHPTCGPRVLLLLGHGKKILPVWTYIKDLCKQNPWDSEGVGGTVHAGNPSIRETQATGSTHIHPQLFGTL